MADIRVQVPDDFMNGLKERLSLKTNADVVQEAFTLLNWAAEEKHRQRLILSTDQNGQSVKRLAMRSLSVISRPESSPWQPIETAPKDRSVLLWWRAANRPLQGRYVCDERGEGWMNDGDRIIPRNQEDCVLWMPLPEGPKT